MSEQSVQRKLTTAFINTMPVELVLRPQVKARTATGGFTWQPGVPRAVQTMRLVEPSTVNNVAPRPAATADGVDREIIFFLLGEWDATIAENDTFTYDGYEWDVVQLAHYNGWERRASVARHG